MTSTWLSKGAVAKLGVFAACPHHKKLGMSSATYQNLHVSLSGACLLLFDVDKSFSEAASLQAYSISF